MAALGQDLELQTLVGCPFYSVLPLGGQPVGLPVLTHSRVRDAVSVTRVRDPS